MKQITCYVGRFKAGIQVPAPLKLFGSPIDHYFRTAAVDAAGDPFIDMTVDDHSRLDDGVVHAGAATNAYWLQESLSRVTRNPPDIKKVRRIGLIFADRWRRDHEVFGLMFDLGFNPQGINPVSSDFTRVPREGCAVFLDPIRAARGSGADFRRQVLFTSIHELGHVFNLWHKSSPVRFMTQSRKEGVHGFEASEFDSDHRVYLQNVDSEHIWPGRARFGSRGDLAQSGFGGSSFAQDLPASRRGLTLRIEAPQAEFWRFEPVELEIELAVKRGTRSSYTLPDKVDPGYEGFDIWIEEPDGTRRPYRSPRLYCDNPGTIRVRPGEAYRRDLSIFAEAGAYTFRTAGRHRLYATFVLPNRTVLRSKTIEVHVRSALDRSAEYRWLGAWLTRPGVARLLYHRAGRPWRSLVEEVGELAARVSDPVLRGNLHYALGRFLREAGRGRSARTERRYLAAAARHLDAALEQPRLSRRRQHHANRLRVRSV